MSTLYREIADDPENLGLSLEDPESSAALLNELRSVSMQPIGHDAAWQWLGTDGRYDRLQEAMMASDDPEWKSAAEVFVEMVRSGVSIGPIGQDPVTDMVLSHAMWDEADVQDLGQSGSRSVSRAEILGLGVVTPEAIRRAILDMQLRTNRQ